MPRPPVRVVILESSAPRRQRLQHWLESDPSLQVAAAVATAAQAIDATARRQAGVIVFGLGEDLAGSVATTRSIMQARATPIVVVTTGSTRVHDQQAFSLLEAGALVVLHAPPPESEAQHAAALDHLLTTVRLMAEVKVVRRWAALAATAAPPAAAAAATRAVPRPAAAALPAQAAARAGRARIELVAIGASTGGPVALRQLLCALPASFPAPIVIVQHMADGFLAGLAEWLSAGCGIATQVAAPGTELRPGHAYLAPDGVHLRVDPDRRLQFDAGPPVNGHQPAVSCLFASVAAHYGPRAIGILLTGMGRDGATELKQMKEAGALTIAQDEASSVVHGMPGEAIRCGGAVYVMSPEEIGAALPALVFAEVRRKPK